MSLQTKSQIEQEISTWEYLVTTLTYEHQRNVKNEILQRIETLKYLLKEDKP